MKTAFKTTMTNHDVNFVRGKAKSKNLETTRGLVLIGKDLSYIAVW
jgi:hypothetical protein